MQRKRDIATKMKLNLDEQQLQELTGEDLMKQREQAAIKEAKKKNSKMRAQSNQVDYLCRAIRENEREELTAHIKEKMDAEEKRFNEENKRNAAKHLKSWEVAVEEKARTAKMIAFREGWLEELYAVRSTRLEAEREKLIELARLKKRKDKLERARKRILENKKRKEAEEVGSHECWVVGGWLFRSNGCVVEVKMEWASNVWFRLIVSLSGGGSGTFGQGGRRTPGQSRGRPGEGRTGRRLASCNKRPSQQESGQGSHQRQFQATTAATTRRS